jgi:hypothetical protein
MHMKEANTSYQHQFFDRLSKRFTSRAELVREVSEVLHVGRDAVYRRLRGDTALTANELILLARAFNVRVEARETTGRSPAMRYPYHRNPIRNEADYFVNLNVQLTELRKLPGARIDFATPELPVYYEMATPLLRSFKTFMFGITTWDIEKWKGKPFSPELIADCIHEGADRMIEGQYTLPTREVWSIGVLDITLRQISYLAEIGGFADPAHIDQLFAELSAIVDHLEHMARTGRRFPMGKEPGPDSPPFLVYHNELSNTNNVVLVSSKVANFLFTTLVNPNYIVTADNDLYAEAHRWFENLVQHGNALHSEGGKYATRYFGYLREQINRYRKRVEDRRTGF